jgi:HD-GYP domain-containing protein (c-di-GMP phosphodiesterase class II)/cell division protein FtsB
MADIDVVKYFIQQIQWLSAAVDAALKGRPIPPVKEKPGGKVGQLIDSMDELLTRYRGLQEPSRPSALEEAEEVDRAFERIQAVPKTEPEAADLSEALKKSERRIEDLILANQALKGHIQYLTEQLTAGKNSLSAARQVEQRLALREAEVEQLKSRKAEMEAAAENLKAEVARAGERLQGEAQVFSAIGKIQGLISVSLPSDEILRRACHIPADFIGCRRSATFLYDDHSESFVPVHAVGMHSALIPVFRSTTLREQDMPLLRELLAQKRPIVMEDCRRFPSRGRIFRGGGVLEPIDGEMPLVPREYLERFETHSLLAVPFISKGKVSGLMFADHGSVQYRFSDDEVAAMDGLGQLVGTVLDNCRIYQDTLKRLLDLERKAGTASVLRQIDEAIFSTNEAQQIFESVIGTIPRVIGCEWASVLLVDSFAKGYYVLGNLGRLIRGKGSIPFEHTSFNGVLRADQVLHRPNLQSEASLSPLDLHLLSNGIGSDLLLPIAVDGEIRGGIHLSSRRVAGFSPEDIVIGQKIARQLAEAVRRATAQRSEDRRKGNGYFEVVRSLVDRASRKDFRLGDYRDQMIACGVDIARSFGMDEEQQEWIKYAILLHDIGKSRIPEHILNKRDHLTEKELAILRTHPIQGAEIIKNFRFSEIIKGMKFVKFVVPLIRHSYERWDGSGYPDGLSGEEIPRGARILSVVNASAAMMMDRPYRRALRPEEAIREIREGSGSQFDPEVVEHFFHYFQEQAN